MIEAYDKIVSLNPRMGRWGEKTNTSKPVMDPPNIINTNVRHIFL